MFLAAANHPLLEKLILPKIKVTVSGAVQGAT